MYGCSYYGSRWFRVFQYPGAHYAALHLGTSQTNKRNNAIVVGWPAASFLSNNLKVMSLILRLKIRTLGHRASRFKTYAASISFSNQKFLFQRRKGNDHRASWGRPTGQLLKNIIVNGILGAMEVRFLRALLI